MVAGEAFDVETNLARLQFYRQSPSNQVAQLLGIATNAPYAVTWTNPAAGNYSLYAIAFDSTGLSATSPPVSVTVSALVVPPPQVFIEERSNLISVSWSDFVRSNALQTTTNLKAPLVWVPVTNAPQAGEGSWFYTFPPNKPRQFFRLVK